MTVRKDALLLFWLGKGESWRIAFFGLYTSKNAPATDGRTAQDIFLNLASEIALTRITYLPLKH